MDLKEELASLKSRASSKKQENKQFFKRLRKKKPKNADSISSEAHHEVFNNEIDCLDCANCCKTTGPLFTVKDIDRIAGKLQMAPTEFIARYLRKDEEGDFVLQQLPCPFLGDDNYCHIYKFRPAACADYPHTHRRKLYRIGDLTVKNTFVCPAAFRIVEKMKKSL